jgi:hypothetical protein
MATREAVSGVFIGPQCQGGGVANNPADRLNLAACPTRGLRLSLVWVSTFVSISSRWQIETDSVITDLNYRRASSAGIR